MRRTALKGRIILLVLFAAFFRQGLAYSQQPAARFFYDEHGNISRQERDTNSDGRMDRWISYNREGKVDRVEQDDNFDGKPDNWLFTKTENSAGRKSPVNATAGSMYGIFSMRGERSSAKSRIPTATGRPMSGLPTAADRPFAARKTATSTAAWTGSSI